MQGRAMLWTIFTVNLHLIAACQGGHSSAPPLAAPNAPTDLLATAMSSTVIQLIWTDTADNEDQFKIERGTDNVIFAEVGIVSANTVTYFDTGLTPYARYYYRVRSATAWQAGAYSNTAEATTLSAVRLAQTGQLTSFSTGSNDDGALRRGVAWPNPRFTPVSSGTGTVVTDNLTGLMWTGDGGMPTFDVVCTGGMKTWQAALDYIACLNDHAYLGYTDWRLPNIRELRTLANYEFDFIATWLNTQGFSNVGNNNYWSSTTTAQLTSSAWYVSMYVGEMSAYDKIFAAYVWPVRAGQNGAQVDVAQTGQLTSFSTGSNDDGAMRKGVDWPNPRFAFASSGTGTVATDKLTGLMWPGDAGMPTFDVVCTGGTKTWQAALNYVACLNDHAYLGYTDWRLPNVNELESLVNFAPANVNDWLNAQGFSNVSIDLYWSSSTCVPAAAYAWNINMWWGQLYYEYKDHVRHVWPVRSDQ